MKITEADREAARTERERGKVRMSEEAKRKIREQKEQAKSADALQAQRMDEFSKLTKNVPNMMGIIRQLWGAPVSEAHLERMARKLLACLDSGLWPSCTSDVTFFATLTRAEERMSDSRFQAELNVHASMKRKRGVP
jgi:hypothetical protein